LYLLFNEGYHGSDLENPLLPAVCADAIRLATLLLELPAADHIRAHALIALFSFHAARLATRMDSEGVFVPLDEQDRSQWDRSLIDDGVVHLAKASTGDALSRWHLEAGIACEHTIAPSVRETNWQLIVDLYDVLLNVAPSPIVAMNRAIAIAESGAVERGRGELLALATDKRLAKYPFFWGGLAEMEKRLGRLAEARSLYERAISLSRSRAERVSFERKVNFVKS
jgi:RNA polymerase sigma-70 factor (ECF subfamily)